MKFGNIIERIEGLPVGIIGTSVAAITISNVYATFNLRFLRDFFMILGTIILILATIKIIAHRKIFMDEYKMTVPGSLYGTYSMLVMLIGSYFFSYFPLFGKTLVIVGIIIHAIFILVFTYLNVKKQFKIETFLPCWFATYNGIMVSTVVGIPMSLGILGKIIVIYGLIIYFLIIPFMVKRLIKFPVAEHLIQTKAVILAPCSLCLIGYLNFFPTPNIYLAFFLYFVVFISLIYVVKNIPAFFKGSFTPVFAATTFPMAIGTVATLRMSGYLTSIGFLNSSLVLRNIMGIQIFLSTVIIGFIYYNFLKKTYVSVKQD
ncbi:MAG: TDT family transporter [Fusobacteriaceae bacterium]